MTRKKEPSFSSRPRKTVEPVRRRPASDERSGKPVLTARNKSHSPIPKIPRWKFWVRLGSFMFTMLILSMLAVTPFFFTLPDISKLHQFDRKTSIQIVSEDGEPIGSFGDVVGEYVEYKDLPKAMVNAAMATEDRRFFEHFGIDVLGILRAMVVNLRAGHVKQGGSTITQQVAKNVFLTSDRTMMRKLQEALLALQLEMRYSKEEIMSIYLNRVYLGSGTFGVSAAAQRYFGKDADELNIAESSILVGMLKAPSRYSPMNNPDLAKKRAEQVIANMVDAKMLTDRQARSAKRQLSGVLSRHQSRWLRAPYFADWVADELSQFLGKLEKDVVVTTTLNPRMQKMADDAVAKVMDAESAPLKASQAALVAMTPDGAVRALVGGRSYGESQYNRATQARRSPGSSFKLFVYLAGLEAGLNAGSVFNDEQVSVNVPGGVWTPSNYDGRFRGEMTLREAVAQSINTIAVQVLRYVGAGRVAEMARRLGIPGPITPAPSLALGAIDTTLLEMTGAYAHMPAEGRMVVPYGIVKVQTTDGEVIYKRKGLSEGHAISSNTAHKMNALLRGVVQSGGTGARANIGRPVAGKTGTSQDYRDALFIGYVPQLVAGVWVGNDNNTSMNKVTGGKLPAQIWAEFMRNATYGMEVQDIPTSTSWTEELLPWQGDANTLPPVAETTEQTITGENTMPFGGPTPEGGEVAAPAVPAPAVVGNTPAPVEYPTPANEEPSAEQIMQPSQAYPEEPVAAPAPAAAPQETPAILKKEFWNNMIESIPQGGVEYDYPNKVREGEPVE